MRLNKTYITQIEEFLRNSSIELHEGLDNILQNVSNTFQFPCTMMYGTFVDNKIVCMCFVTYYQAFPYEPDNISGKIALITGLRTLKEFREKGYARSLLSEVINDAYINGMEQICSDALNTSAELLKDLGFVEDENETRLWHSVSRYTKK